MKNYKVGYTTGVYDMFHVGHLNLLKRAKENCDYLIVGVTSDELVSYKKKQAIIPHSERIVVLLFMVMHQRWRTQLQERQFRSQLTFMGIVSCRLKKGLKD